MKSKSISVIILMIMLFTMFGNTAVFASTKTSETVSHPIVDSFAGGTGTEEDPYQIETAEQLAYLSYLCSKDVDMSYSEQEILRRACYILTDDIELNDISDFENWDKNPPAYEWTPIGIVTFEGVFDGQGHSIRGMYICDTTVYGSADREVGYHPGLFASARNARICNLKLEDSYIALMGVASDAGGIIAYASDSIIENCESAATIHSESAHYLGGVIGNCRDTDVIDCVFSGDITIQGGKHVNYVGGVINWYNGDGVVSGCVNRGTIQALSETDYIYTTFGGVIDLVWPGQETIIEDCRNEADIDLGNAEVGGVFRKIYVDKVQEIVDWENTYYSSSLVLSDCSNTGNIVTTYDGGVGGIVSKVLNGGYECAGVTIKNCSNTGDITGVALVGGVFGYISSVDCPLEIRNCENSGTVTGVEKVGGLIGQIGSGLQEQLIVACSNSGTVTASNGSAGGISGFYWGLFTQKGDAIGPTIRQCVNSGRVSANGSIPGAGGIVGECMSADGTLVVEDCLNEGEVGGFGSVRAGGILGDSSFGRSDGKHSVFEIRDCVNTGDIRLDIEDIIMATEKQSLLNHLAEGEKQLTQSNASPLALILGGSSLGGIAGYCQDGVIENCVSAGGINVSSAAVPIYSIEDAALFSALGFSGEELDSPVFAGGICGVYYSEYKVEKGTMAIDTCWYSEQIPCGAVVVDAEYENTIHNVNGVSLEELMSKAME